MTVADVLRWARSLDAYERTVQRLVQELGWPEEAARTACDLTVLAKTRLGRRVLASEPLQ